MLLLVEPSLCEELVDIVYIRRARWRVTDQQARRAVMGREIVT